MPRPIGYRAKKAIPAAELQQTEATAAVRVSVLNATETAVKLAAEHNINLADVTGSGADGRILKSDVEAHLADAENAEVPESAEVEEASNDS